MNPKKDNQKENTQKESQNDLQPEIPNIDPPTEIEPIKDNANKDAEHLKHKERMRGVKFAYAFALLIAFGGAISAKIATEKALGNVTPIEPPIVTIAESKRTEPDYNKTTKPSEYEVRQNLTNVPDTRNETKIQEKKEKETKPASPYAVPYKDYYCLPVGTDILNDYSPKTPIYNPTTNDWRTHNGVDFSGAQGDQVKAIAYGIVKKVYTDPLYGTIIEIDHGNNVLAKYCGFNKNVVEVKPGDKVESGSLLGYLGTIPIEKSSISHLHLEIFYKNENVDPLELMGK